MKFPSACRPAWSLSVNVPDAQRRLSHTVVEHEVPSVCMARRVDPFVDVTDAPGEFVSTTLERRRGKQSPE